MVPNDGSDKPKYVALCCLALKCCVWRYTLFVFHLQQPLRDEFE